MLATNNDGKVREFAALLADLPVRLTPAREAGIARFPPEAGQTFGANARAKALYVTAQTGRAALADDSGLVVDALGGEPGVYTARYGGSDISDAERYNLLLVALRSVPPHARTARFIAAIALSLPDAGVIESVGELDGRIAGAPRGTNGFGYDPIFIVEDTDRTLAEMADDEKNGISHRARAIGALRPRLRAVLSLLEG